ncbi:MAG: hypothetical protein K2Z80_05850 [Xanthobacteraceae bacterium]|nr:hypothetical protein [Xanthobacteraceae bacterium]
MADYFTDLSCLLDVGTPENAARALELYNCMMKDNAAEDSPSDAFLLSIQPEHGGTQLWIRNEATGDPQAVIDFVLHCAEAFDLKGRWGFQWANTCSRPRVNAFGGGAHVLDLGRRKTVAWIATNPWLDTTLSAGRTKRGTP